MGCVLCFLGCDDNRAFHQYQSLSHGWDENDTISFQFNGPKASGGHDLFIHIRNDDRYPYSNLFLIVEMRYPQGNIKIDTLEYAMAYPDGRWMGKGFTDIKESKLWYQEGFFFEEGGDYSVHIAHAMRTNGQTQGIGNLEGILDVGFCIEESQN